MSATSQDAGSFFARYGWLFLVALVAIGVVSLSNVSGDYTVSLSARQIQARIDSELDRDFPVKGAARRFVASVRAQSAHVDLHDDRVGFAIDAAGNLVNGRSFTATILAAGAPRYEDGAFFFEPENIEVKNFAYEGASPGEIVARLGDRLGLGDKAKRLLAEGGRLAEEWIPAFAEDIARNMLAKRPVYRLRDDLKGVVIKSSLKSIAVVGDRLVLTLDTVRLGAFALFGLACLAVALALLAALLLFRSRSMRG